MALPGRLELPSQPPEGYALSIKLWEHNVVYYTLSMRQMPKVLALLVGVHLALIVITNRALFFSRFDADYWKDRYEHSQWKLPLSTRTIGDDGLYLYEGYQLLRGANPAGYNPEVPPLGKYAIGASIYLFGNGHWYGFVVTLASLVAFYLLAKMLLKSQLSALCATSLLTLDPLITTQFTLTMTDSLQLFLAIVTLLGIVQGKPILAGIALGLFSETKFPVFTPVLFLLGAWVFWKKNKNIQPLIVFAVFALLASLTPYARYFLFGHDITQWIGLHKWIVEFYRQSRLVPNWGSLWMTLVAGFSQNLFTRAWDPVTQWSPLWPVVSLAGLTGLAQPIINQKQKVSLRLLPVASFTCAVVILYSLIPFWTRYLVLVLPFLYLGTFLILERFPKPHFIGALTVALLLVNIAVSLRVVLPTPQATVEQVTYAWSRGFFQDLYEELTTHARTPLDRWAFHRFGQQVYRDAQIETVTVETGQVRWSRVLSPQYVPLRVTYHTRHLGSFTKQQTIPVISENGRWRIPWEWSMLITGLTPKGHLETTVEETSRGSIIAVDKSTHRRFAIAQDVPGQLVWVTPNRIGKEKEPDMLRVLEEAFEKRLGQAAIHHRYVGNNQPDWAVPIGVLPGSVKKSVTLRLLEFPGISVTNHLTRLRRDIPGIVTGWTGNSSYRECCSILYTTTSYDGTGGLELAYNSRLKGLNGGTLVIKDENGSVVQTLITSIRRDGSDVVLPETQ